MRYNSIKTIFLLVILGILINVGISFIRGGSKEDNGPGVHQLEMNLGDSNIYRKNFGPEWSAIPVVFCLENTRSDEKWIKSRYVLTLENGLIIGSENYVLSGDTTFCWINNYHTSKVDPRIDSVVFQKPL